MWRVFRTIDELTLGWRNLRERLPAAFDNGFGTIGESEVDVISGDLGREFRAITGKMYAVEDPEIGYAAASVAEMTGGEVHKFAAQIRDFWYRHQGCC